MIIENLFSVIAKNLTLPTEFIYATKLEADTELDFSKETYKIILESVFDGTTEKTNAGLIKSSPSISFWILANSELDHKTEQRTEAWYKTFLIKLQFLNYLDFVFFDPINKVFVFDKNNQNINFIKVVLDWGNLNYTRVLNQYSLNSDGLLITNMRIELNEQFISCLSKTIYE